MNTVRVGEIEMAYDDVGRGEPPLVLVHGFTGSRDDFADVLAALAEGRRVLAPDQRGHGDSTNTGRAEGYDLATMVRDLGAFLDAVGASRCHLLGHSMGGMVAMHLALAAPERLASLVLMDTASGPIDLVPAAAREAGVKIAREQGMRVLHQILRARSETDPATPPSVRRAIERAGADAWNARVERKMFAMDPEAFATLLSGLGMHEDVTPRLAEITCPTTVLVGAEDAPFLAPSARMAAAIPGARHVVVQDAAHCPQMENRDAWLTEMRAHLSAAQAA